MQGTLTPVQVIKPKFAAGMLWEYNHRQTTLSIDSAWYSIYIYYIHVYEENNIQFISVQPIKDYLYLFTVQIIQ